MGLLSHIKHEVPWQMKVISKLVLSRLPVDYRTWQLFQLFRHGAMDEPKYAYDVFKRHFELSDFGRKSGGFISLEVGPGDSLFSCLIAKAFGGAKTWLIDAGPFAHDNAEGYRKMSEFLTAQGHPIDVSLDGGLTGILEQCNASYGTRGLASLREIPNASVDWIWSQAVLEHIRRVDFPSYMHELRRVLRPDGICSHRVDLRDHLAGALNNLRFAESVWEAEWMAGSGFYTNRIQFQEMCEMFERAKFAVELVDVERWQVLPTPRARLAAPFKAKRDEALLVKGFDVLLRPR